MDRYNQQGEDMSRKHEGQGDDTGSTGYGRGDLNYTPGAGFGGGDERDSRLELNDLHEEMARMSLAGYGVNNGTRSGTRTPPPQTPTMGSKGSAGSLNVSLSESSIATPRATGTRTGYNQKLDSHSRLFGAPDQKDAYMKPNHMKSDIFGIGFGSGDYQQKRMTSPKPVIEKPEPHAGGGDYFEYQKTTQARRSSEGIKSPPVSPPSISAGAASEMPTSNARENGGNPVTGTGYQPDGRAQRRRQFTKTQFAPTGFW